MKISYSLLALTTCLLIAEIVGEQKVKSKHEKKTSTRTTRQLNNNNNNADQMVQNILRWLQDVYGSQGRRSRSYNFAQDLGMPYYFASARIDHNAFRQGSLREYLPPTPGEKPRPFTSRPSTGGGGVDEDGNFVDSGYPPAGITPQPPFSILTNPATGGITGVSSPGKAEESLDQGTNYPTQGTARPGYTPTSYPGRGGYSTETPEVTEEPIYPGSQTSGQTFITPEITAGYPSGVQTAITQDYPTSSPSGFTTSSSSSFTGYPSDRPTEASGESGYPYPTSSQSGFTGYPSVLHSSATGFPTRYPTNRPTPQRDIVKPTERGYPTSSNEGIDYPTSGFTGYPSSRPTSEPTAYPTRVPTYSNGDGTVTVSSTEGSGFPTSRPSKEPGYLTGPTGYSTGIPTGGPSFPSRRPSSGSIGYPTGGSTGTIAPTSYPTEGSTGLSVGGYSTGRPTASAGFPTARPPSGTGPTGPPRGETPSITEQSPDESGTSSGDLSGFPTERRPGLKTTESPTERPTEGIRGFPTVRPPGVPDDPQEPTGPTEDGRKTDEDLKHPPHIHALDVQCAKDMMTINIEFNREFNGVIYSKGYYNMPECRYVNENSGQTKYIFTVNLNMCGTEFVNAFDTEGQSYLENILVLQNELGIQEVWDTVRSVRCLWEGNLKEQLSVTLMVGMLSQEIVTFSGDTAMAKLDVLLGRGLFGQPASGLVKIGEPMTLVVSVSGDPGFDIQVKDCRATDSSGTNVVPLTDDNGCILKPKLFGSFQKTRNTGETGASIIAYAYFNAFKFPDVMDIMIECNIELCKTDCEMCPDLNPQLEPAKRRKRDLDGQNETLHDSLKMSKHLRVVLPEDITSAPKQLHESVCMSTQNFMYTSSLLVSLLSASCLLSTYFWFKMHKLKSKI